jgi:hypothetical protein
MPVHGGERKRSGGQDRHAEEEEGGAVQSGGAGAQCQRYGSLIRHRYSAQRRNSTAAHC